MIGLARMLVGTMPTARPICACALPLVVTACRFEHTEFGRRIMAASLERRVAAGEDNDEGDDHDDGRDVHATTAVTSPTGNDGGRERPAALVVKLVEGEAREMMMTARCVKAA